MIALRKGEGVHGPGFSALLLSGVPGPAVSVLPLSRSPGTGRVDCKKDWKTPFNRLPTKRGKPGKRRITLCTRGTCRVFVATITNASARKTSVASTWKSPYISRDDPPINHVPCRHRAGACLSIVLRVIKRKDKRGVDLISDARPFGRLWYGGLNAVSNAVDYAKFRSRSHRALIRVYDGAGNVIETHEHARGRVQ